MSQPLHPGPLLAIRADASHGGGTGHIMRSLAVAQEWTRRGGRCTYLCCSLPESLEERLVREQCGVVRLEAEPGSDQDAEATSAFLAEHRPHWLLIDGYDLAQPYQQKLQRPRRTQVAVMSDFGPEDYHQADLVVFPSVITDTRRAEEEETTFLRKIPLRRELLREHSPAENSLPDGPPPPASRLLVTMGGSDPLDASPAVVEHLIKSKRIDSLSCRVILGPAYKDTGRMRTLNHPNLEVVDAPGDMSPHYQWADTAISSPSTTAYELVHHGLPTGLIITAENQVAVCESLCDFGACIKLADMRSSKNLDQEALTTLLDDVVNRMGLTIAAEVLVDGSGASSICYVMGLPDISLRTATAEDAKLLFEWANDPTTRQASFHSDPIAWDDHLKWMKDSLNNPDRVLMIAVDEVNPPFNQPLGQCRFDREGTGANDFVISLSIAPERRSRGIAPIILTRAREELLALNPEARIIAWIKPENTASLRTFERAGYRRSDCPEHPERIRMCR